MGVLEQVARRAGEHGVEHRALVGRDGEHEHRAVRRGVEHAARGLDARHAGHVDVHHDDVGLELRGLLDRLVAATRLGDDLEAVVLVQEPAQAGAEEVVVVDDEDADGGVRRSRVVVEHRAIVRVAGLPRRLDPAVAWLLGRPQRSSA